MTERRGFTFRGVTANTERRTVAIRLTLLLTLLASCLAFAPTASAQVWRSNLNVADLSGLLPAAWNATGCISDPDNPGPPDPASCGTRLSNPSFRLDGKTYQISNALLMPLWGDIGSPVFWINLDPPFPRKLRGEPWKVCVNDTALSLSWDQAQAREDILGISWRYPKDFWEIGDSVRLAITSGSCP